MNEDEKLKWTKQQPDMDFMRKSLDEYMEVVKITKKDLLMRKAALVRALKENKK